MLLYFEKRMSKLLHKFRMYTFKCKCNFSLAVALNEHGFYLFLQIVHLSLQTVPFASHSVPKTT